MAKCLFCPREVEQSPTGRPRRFCSDRCRRRRHQRKRTLRRQVESYGELAALNPEPYSSMWAYRQAEAQAELSKLS